MMAVAEQTAYIFPDILSLLRIQAEKHGVRNGIETEEAPPLTYQAILDRSTIVAKCIFAACSNEDGRRPRIGMVLPNGAEMAVTLLGVVAAGAALPFNPSYREAEFESYFNELCLDALLVRMDDDGPAISAATRAGIEILRLSSDGGLEGIEPDTNEVPLPAPDDVALVLLTSGSTGRAKSVPLTHRNICSSVDDICRSMKLTADDRCLSMWEQYHVGGLVDLLLAPLASGGTVLCTGGFNATAFFRILGTLKPTWFQGVPTTLNELVFHAARNPVEPQQNSLRLIRAVAAALSPALMAEVESLFRVPVIQTFGMTEAGPLISSTRLPPSIRKSGSVGNTCGTDIRIVGPDGSACPVGESGEIAVRGLNVFSGYENDPLANEAQFRNGWFHTGDTGYIDADGDLFLTGRIKQIINRGGEKVNPQEIEDALLTHPAIGEAAVYPLKHRTLGEEVAAAIVLRGSAEISEIRAFLSSRLAHFKIPQGIAILESLPRNRIGKIDKIALAGAHEEGMKKNLTFTPPRNRLEAYLANLWATELDIYTVGVHDDFAAIGGDSLSSLRILVAVETLFRIKVPERMSTTFTTVARMAEQLQSLGCSSDGGDIQLSRRDARALLLNVRVGLYGSEDDLELALRELEACEDWKEFRTLSEAITLYSTPAETHGIITRMRPLLSFKLGDRLKHPFSTLAMELKRQWWRHRILWELNRQRTDTVQSLTWVREPFCEDASLYQNPNVDPGNKALIVGFTGNSNRLMMPAYKLLRCIDSDRFDLLLVRDRKRKHYAYGIVGVSDTLDGVARALEEFAKGRKYLRSIALGTSAGGIPSIYVALKNHWSRAVAVGADDPSRHPILADLLKCVTARSDQNRETRIHLCYSAKNTRDSSAATKNAVIFNQAKLFPDSRFHVHNLLYCLYKKGELPGFLSGQFGSDSSNNPPGGSSSSDTSIASI